jgi:cellulose synthase/poly-beta-1,6-N-acetylglucosamine synthase-like glycosyltransferase
MALLTSMSTIVLCTLAVLPAAFRILVAMAPSREFSSFASATKDGDLPVYTIIAPLHREARVVDQLLSAIEQLDYPAEKLDVIVVVEADEPATRAAITQRKHRLPITVVPAPPAEPRHETQSTQYCPRACARLICRDLRRGRPERGGPSFEPP